MSLIGRPAPATQDRVDSGAFQGAVSLDDDEQPNKTLIKALGINKYTLKRVDRPIGSRLRSINDSPAQKLLPIVIEFASTDSTLWRRRTKQQAATPPLESQLAAYESKDRFRLTRWSPRKPLG